MFEFWNRALELTKVDDQGKRSKLTTDMGRRTFCTFAERLFNFSADDVMAVSHHDDPKSYKGYVVNSSFCDPEKECAINTKLKKRIVFITFLKCRQIYSLSTKKETQLQDIRNLQIHVLVG